MSVSPNASTANVIHIEIDKISPNENNPRLDFPQEELSRLAESISQKGILVPINVYQSDDKYVLIDGERRFRCARELGLETVPALITIRQTEHETLVQMFNIHQIREAWRDIPTALALKKLVDHIESESGTEPTDQELRELTGLSVERIRRFRYVVTLPKEWQDYIRNDTIPLNFFWELKRYVIDALASKRPKLLDEYGRQSVLEAFVEKRLSGVLSDTVSLRNFAAIVNFSAREAESSDDGTSDIDDAIREVITSPDATIDEAYENTVQMMVEVDKLGRRTVSMVAAFRRLLQRSNSAEERREVRKLGQRLIEDLNAVLIDFDETEK